jgi:hypothetical protein
MKVPRPANHWISGSEMPNDFASLPSRNLPNQTETDHAYEKLHPKTIPFPPGSREV